MRVLQVIPTYLPAWRHGGPVFAVHGLAKALVAAGHEVEVFTTNVHGDGTLDVETGRPQELDGVRVTYFPVGFPRRLHRAPALGAALSERIASFDVAHLHSLFLWPTLIAARAAEHAGVPYLVAPRGMLARDPLRRRGTLRKRLWLALCDRRTVERAAGLHVTAALERAEAERFGWRLPPVFEVPNGLDPAALGLDPAAPAYAGARPSPAVATALAGGPYVLFLGRLSWKKGLDRLLAALPHAPEARLVVAGNDEEALTPRLVAQAQELGVRGRLSFVGPVNGFDKAALLAGASVFALSSYAENFGNAVLEAMAVRVPVVVSPEVGLAPVVAETASGLVVPGEPAALGAALAGLLADPARRAAMGACGAATVATRFGWDGIARQMAKVYAKVYARVTAGRPTAARP